jgi:hypothetical protein
MSELSMKNFAKVAPHYLFLAFFLLLGSASSYAFNGNSTEHCGTKDNIDYDVEINKEYCIAGTYEHMILEIPKDNTDVTIKTSGGTGYLGLYGKEGIWAYDDDHHIASANANTTEQEFTINLDSGVLFFLTQGDFEGVTLEISTAPGAEKPANPNSCGADTIDDFNVELGQSCISGRYKDMALYVEDNDTDITVTTSSGSGELLLYASTESWASSRYYDEASHNESTTEQTLTINADVGYVYILAEGEFDGVTVSISNGAESNPESDDSNNQEQNNNQDPNEDQLPMNEERFLGLTGNELIDRIVNSTIDQISPVFGVTGEDATSLFSEANMLNIVDAIGERVPTYTGVDDEGVENLIYYLRGFFYVQFYFPEDVSPYTSALRDNITTVLSQLFAKDEFWTVSNENGLVLSEALILLDSSELMPQFMDVIIRVLNEYDDEWNAFREMNIAANSIYYGLLRSRSNEAFKEFLAENQSILDALFDFQARNRHLLGTNEEYLLINATRELSRLFHVPEMFDRVKVMSKAMIDSSSRFDETKPIWLSVGSIVEFYDGADCDYYGICGFSLQVEMDALPFNYRCSDTLKIRAQHMFNDQAEWICGVLEQQESFFHSELATGLQPVDDDLNESLELVIFDSSDDYQDYAGIIFGVSTNNGGIYLEGQPSEEGNQARFIAYEAEWMKPDFHVWNLQHEYVHYLDGRFNIYGDFSHSLSVDLIWWAEGLGEYISIIDDNRRAIDLGKSQEYDLATIFSNTYSSGSDRIYRWGYLAVRFVFERHLSDVSSILDLIRTNELENYQALLTNISELYEDEWQEWLVSELSTSESGIVQFGPNDTESADSGSLGNWDGDTLAGVSTDFSQCIATEAAYDPDESRRLEVGDISECIFSGRRTPAFSMPEPYRSSNRIRISVSGGWGDASILYRAGRRPTSSEFDAKSDEQGNDDELIIDLDSEHYWHYLAIEGDFGGVKLEITPVR